mgnify:CR=1 FL=1
MKFFHPGDLHYEYEIEVLTWMIMFTLTSAALIVRRVSPLHTPRETKGKKMCTPWDLNPRRPKPITALT